MQPRARRSPSAARPGSEGGLPRQLGDPGRTLQRLRAVPEGCSERDRSAVDPPVQHLASPEFIGMGFRVAGEPPENVYMLLRKRLLD